VNTLGLILLVIVHSAGIQDRDGAKSVLGRVRDQYGSVKRIRADGIYAGKLVDWVKDKLHIILDIVKRDSKQRGFKVLPKRWIVERTFGWFGRYRRRSKDYECKLARKMRNSCKQSEKNQGAPEKGKIAPVLRGAVFLWIILVDLMKN
jgi:transposase